MTFQLQQNTQSPAHISSNGNIYTLQSQSQYDIQQGGSHTFDTGYTLIQIPPNCVLTIQTSDDLEDCSNTKKRYQQKDSNSRISIPFHSHKKKKIKRGDKIFNMILQNISQTALDILPFLAKQKQKKKFLL